MAALDISSSESEPLFSESEWNAAMPGLTTAMMAFLKQYRTPIFIDHGDHGVPWGSGSFIELDSRKFILTNEHVAAVRNTEKLGYCMDDCADMYRIIGDHVAQEWPWDLALLPVMDAAWSGHAHGSVAIQEEQLGLAHTPFPAEVFAITGYAGERTQFLFGSMLFESTTHLAREVELAVHTEIDNRFHFGLAYLPDLAATVEGKKGLPKPPGLSGSTVWNTCFVEAKAKGLIWTPSLAKVAGVVWGWPSGQGALVATKIEHVRSFLLGAVTTLK